MDGVCRAKADFFKVIGDCKFEIATEGNDTNDIFLDAIQVYKRSQIMYDEAGLAVFEFEPAAKIIYLLFLTYCELRRTKYVPEV